MCLKLDFDPFFREAEKCVKSKIYWPAVIGAHEIFRRLYPCEPFSSVKRVTLAQLQKIINEQAKFIKQCVAAVEPYKNSRIKDTRYKLERRTSELYGSQWLRYDFKGLLTDSVEQLKKRLLASDESLAHYLENSNVLDLGCGSGRYSFALSKYCRKVIGYDYGIDGIRQASFIADKFSMKNVSFVRGNIFEIPFENCLFDFIFCNGVLHHTCNWKSGIFQIFNLLRKGGKAWIYLYGTGGLFWNFRKRARRLFRKIPSDIAQNTLDAIGLPKNRYIFMDTWYVPVETQISRFELEKTFRNTGFSEWKKIIGHCDFDLDRALLEDRREGKIRYGEGEHRYLLVK